MGAIISAPISMLATCGGSLLGSCCASLTCKACSCSCILPKRGASIMYCGTLSLFVFLALIFRYSNDDIVIGGGYNKTDASIMQQALNVAWTTSIDGAKDSWNGRFWCASKHPSGWVICCQDVCGGVYSVYRFSFSLCLFFAFLTVLTMGSSKIGARAHRGFWFLKAFTLLSLLVSTLFISNETLEGYREAARYFSILFLLMQILLLIDFGYRWNETWLDYAEKSEIESCCNWRTGILASAATLFIGSLAVIIVLYVQFGHSGCPAQQTVISLTLILSLGLTITSCTKIAPHGTVLTSAVVTAYATYLCYSALASHPDGACNPLKDRNTNSISDTIFGLLIAAISIAGTAWSATGSKDALIGKEQGSDLSATLEDASGATKEAGGDDEEEITAESWWYYHLMMVACSFYMAMLLTDWSGQPYERNGAPAVSINTGGMGMSTSLGSFWVKIASQWVCLLMYAWTLLAPYCLREYRDFGVEFDF